MQKININEELEYLLSPVGLKEYKNIKAEVFSTHNTPDVEGRYPKDSIREIANDLISGKRVRVEFRTGNCYSILRLEVFSKDFEIEDRRFLVHLDYYELEPDELFFRETLIRSGKKVYWRGYEKKRAN